MYLVLDKEFCHSLRSYSTREISFSNYIEKYSFHSLKELHKTFLFNLKNDHVKLIMP